MLAVTAPGRTVVHGHAIGQTVETEDRGESILNGLCSLIGTGLKPQSEARVIVENGQRVAAGRVGCEVAFEVHLPEQIGSGVFEALEGSVLERLFRVHPAVSQQDLVDGAGRWQVGGTCVQQASAKLASPPGRMAIPQVQHRLLDHRRTLSRAVIGSATLIEEPFPTAPAVTAK